MRLSTNFSPRIFAKILMPKIFLALCWLVFLVSKTPAHSSEPALLEGEICLEGRVINVNAAGNIFDLSASSFAVPEGRKQIFYNFTRHKKIQLPLEQPLVERGSLRALGRSKLKKDIYALVIGVAAPAGVLMRARTVALWNRMSGAQYRLDINASTDTFTACDLDFYLKKPVPMAPLRLPLESGQIQITGVLQAIDREARTLTVQARLFTLPGGRSAPIAQMALKAATLAPATALRLGDGAWEAPGSSWQRLAPGDVIVMSGADAGQGSVLDVKALVAWKPERSPARASNLLAAPGLAKFEPVRGCLLGAYIADDPLVCRNVAEFNQLTGIRHASFFKYLQYGEEFPSRWMAELKAQGAFPHIAWEPRGGLEKVQNNAYLAKFAQAARDCGVPIFLRFASEMNGRWVPWHGNPRLYKQKFALVHDVMAKAAPNVAMVWTVFTMPQEKITAYYPGDQYVDWVGVNVYNVVYHDNDPKRRATHEDPLQLMGFVYRTYSRRKPIQISEYGASNSNLTDGRDYSTYSIAKLTRMYANLKRYPRVKSIFYFNVNTLQQGYNARRAINNYALTTHPQVLAAYQKLVRDPYFIGANNLYYPRRTSPALRAAMPIMSIGATLR